MFLETDSGSVSLFFFFFLHHCRIVHRISISFPACFSVWTGNTSLFVLLKSIWGTYWKTCIQLYILLLVRVQVIKALRCTQLPTFKQEVCVRKSDTSLSVIRETAPVQENTPNTLQNTVGHVPCNLVQHSTEKTSVMYSTISILTPV